jgi:hypothetical protein
MYVELEASRSDSDDGIIDGRLDVPPAMAMQFEARALPSFYMLV